MFQQQISAGGTPEYWDTSWEQGVTDRIPGDASCEDTALHALFMQTLRPDGLFLEGGCGPGHWVKYFHERATEATLKALERRVTVGPDGLALPPARISESGYLPQPHKNKHGMDYPPPPPENTVYPGARTARK